MAYFGWLLLAHLVGDYPLQTNWIYAQKVRSLVGGLWHAGVLWVCYACALAPFLTNPAVAGGVGVLTLLHFAQDFWKARVYDSARHPALPGYLLDQLAHVGTYALFAAMLAGLSLPPAADWWVAAWQGPFYPGYLALGLLLSTFFWDVTAHVARRHTLANPIYQRAWQGMLRRGALWLVLYGGWVLLQPSGLG